MLDSFKKDGPFSAALKCEEALEKVNTFKESVSALKDQEAQIRRGLSIFKIEQPPNKDVAVLEKVKRIQKMLILCMISGFETIMFFLGFGVH